jgi:hypothetical protein
LRKVLIFGIILGLLYSCSRESQEPFSFFVAGHTYGTPTAENPGLYPAFMEMFESLNADPTIEFGILTGDIVRKSTDEAWDTVKMQLESLDKVVHFCPGNHDVNPRAIYETRHGKAYYAFTHKKNLFIILDGNLNRWNIEGPQLDFLKSTLAEGEKEIANVFVFVHQLIWWDENNVFSQVNLNWPPYTPDTTNYWSEVEPMLQSFNRPVFIFAGDLGANRQASSLMYYPDRNITYLASGMGNIEMDNFLLVHINSDNKVEIEIIALEGDQSKFGKIENYLLR